MSARVYVLLGVIEGKADQVAGALRDKAGVRMVDMLESPPEVIMAVGSIRTAKAAAALEAAGYHVAWG